YKENLYRNDAGSAAAEDQRGCEVDERKQRTDGGTSKGDGAVVRTDLGHEAGSRRDDRRLRHREVSGERTDGDGDLGRPRPENPRSLLRHHETQRGSEPALRHGKDVRRDEED